MVKIWYPSLQLPYLVMIVKNMKKYFTFEVQVLDDKNVRRRFRASNYQSTTRVRGRIRDLHFQNALIHEPTSLFIP